MSFKQNELGMAAEWSLGRVNAVTRKESTARDDDEGKAVALKWSLPHHPAQKAVVHGSTSSTEHAAWVGISALSLTGCLALGISWPP